MKLKNILFENVDAIYSSLDSAIPDETNVKDFATALGKFIKNEYGTHNIKPFMDTLHASLGLDEQEITEEPETRQKVVDLDTLSFDLLMSMFGKKPMFGFNLPNPDDSYRSVFDQDSLDNWKEGIEKKYGNVNIKIDTEAASQWDRIQILDDKFRADKKARVAGKAAWLSKEREAGRSTD